MGVRVLIVDDQAPFRTAARPSMLREARRRRRTPGRRPSRVLRRRRPGPRPGAPPRTTANRGRPRRASARAASSRSAHPCGRGAACSRERELSARTSWYEGLELRSLRTSLQGAGPSKGSSSVSEPSPRPSAP